MTNRHKIELRRSEIRKRLGDISGLTTGEGLTTEIRTEMDGLMVELRDSEPTLQAAILSEGQDAAIRSEVSGESAERSALIGRAELRSFITAAVSQSEVQGAEKEILECCPVSPEVRNLGGSPVPWEVLAPRISRGMRRREERVDAATALPATGPQTQELGFVGRVFASGSASFLGVSMLDVPVGEASYFVLSSGAAPEFKAVGVTQDAAAATLVGNVLQPHRITASYVLRLEDAARSSMYENGLRTDLGGALSEVMDQTVLLGAAPAPPGIIPGITKPSDPSGVNTSFAQFLALAAAGVDGRYARSLRDVRVLLGPQSYQAGAAAVTTAGDVSATDYLLQRSGGLMSSALIGAPAGATEIQDGLVAKVGAETASAVAAMWAGVSLIIRDDYTRASRGEVRLTAVGLWDFKVLREAAFSRFLVRLKA